MKTPRKSKTSLKPIGKRVTRRIVVAKPVWDDWKYNEIQSFEFEGKTYQAVKTAGLLYAGEKLTKSTFAGVYTGQAIALQLVPFAAGGAGSCAYGRVYPQGSTNIVMKCWKWYLYNIKLDRGHLAYLTKLDTEGDQERLTELHYALKKRGFKLVSVNKSVHTGSYPVWLYVHPGDDVILAERNKKKNKAVKSESNVLGNTDAGVPQPGAAGGAVAGDAAAPVVPDAYAFAA